MSVEGSGGTLVRPGVSLRIVSVALAGVLTLAACSLDGGRTAPRPSASATPVVERPSIPRDLTVVVTGDSVPLHLEAALSRAARERLGWRVVDASVPACSIYGDSLVWPDGRLHGRVGKCHRVVLKKQRRALKRMDPDIVLWWDRLSTMPFLSGDGSFVRPGSEEFWRLRMAIFEEAVERLSARGAWIVFVATEPIGVGLLDRCAGWKKRGCRVWRRFRMRRYDDVTRSMNLILEQYASAHPADAAFVSITDTICRIDISPCDDVMWNGKPARPDGTHYDGLGEVRAARAIVHELRKALVARLTATS
jgi:hypothetical protein